MKKFVFIFSLAVLTGSMVWAQYSSPASNDPDFAGRGIERFQSAIDTGLSTEGQNSAGRFGSYADDFVDPRFFNPDLEGTFLFLGANISELGAGADKVDLGFARNFGAFYLGVYFGGNIATAYGGRTQQTANTNPNANTRADSWMRDTNWNNNLAVLFGIGNMGFRLDFAMNRHNTRDSFESKEDNTQEWDRSAGPTLALTWGADFGILPFVRVGYRFADVTWLEEASNPEGGTATKTTEKTLDGAAIEVAAGAHLPLANANAVGGELWFNNRFQNTRAYTYSDDTPNYTSSGLGDAGAATTGEAEAAGWMGFGLNVYYSQTLDFGSVSLGFKPFLNAGLRTSNDNRSYSHGESGPSSDNKTSWEVIGWRYITLDMGLNVGARWQASQHIAFFSGINMRIFDWTTRTETGINTMNNATDTAKQQDAQDSAWRFSGMVAENFNIGMTFTTANEIVFGLQANPFFNGLFGNGGMTTTNPAFNFTVSARY